MIMIMIMMIMIMITMIMIMIMMIMIMIMMIIVMMIITIITQSSSIYNIYRWDFPWVLLYPFLAPCLESRILAGFVFENGAPN